MKTYLNFLRFIRDHGVDKPDRTGTGIRSVFGYDMRFDLSAGFPLVTTKRVFIKGVVCELLWFLRGETNIEYLKERNVAIWDEWADQRGHLGPVYGKQWRAWSTPNGAIDQISRVLELIQTDPNSRRLVVSAWNVGELDQMALPPCHLLFQFYVANGRLSCKLTQRSADAFLGVPFNIASYALLTHLVALHSGLSVGDLIWSGGDCHIYHNHFEQVELQLLRTPYPLPTLRILRKRASLFEYEWDDFEWEGYQSHPVIRAQIAV